MPAAALGFLPLVLLAGRAAAPGPAGTLAAQLDATFDRPALRTAFVGAEVLRLDDARVLYARQAERSFTPASVQKLVTTAAALDALGPDERLRTTLESAAAPDAQGSLAGDLYLVGRGDANLSGRFSEGRVTAALEELA